MWMSVWWPERESNLIVIMILYHSERPCISLVHKQNWILNFNECYFFPIDCFLSQFNCSLSNYLLFMPANFNYFIIIVLPNYISFCICLKLILLCEASDYTGNTKWVVLLSEIAIIELSTCRELAQVIGTHKTHNNQPQKFTQLYTEG